MRGGRSAGRHARGRRPGGTTAGSIIRRTAFVSVAIGLVTFGAPVVAATADPKPSLKQLSAEVERLYTQIETLTEQYNGERVRLKAAQRSADLAKKNLAKSEAELEVKRQKASLLAQNSYMTGGLGSALALIGNTDPSQYLDQASTTYALEMQQGQEVAEVSKAMDAAARAKASATARQSEVKKLLTSLDGQRTKIEKLVKRAESNLYSRVAGSVSTGRATRISFPVVGDGKAAEAARWALSQQMRPYVWGAAGPTSFDCSGLVMAAYQQVGISLPHYTGDQWTAGTHISRDELRPGDLVFFYPDLHHVGIYIGGGYMVHAPHTGDVVRVAPLGNRPFAGGVRIAD
ncbi:C40 family peptidase [Microbispora sp. ATCC PTA-5024]|uniref:C40 family peptidase n=1 Tax=Microbispora sp. ATCC PTA-5024 TaxID=316330 RepID=UPI0003DD3799|nr:C40 family peptidase [Microbispora sp. ATCC PTA-5024]ETK35423.1 hydrolase [Microbispora sp. ATCC PTA-5024]